jgi:uncharacterized protein (DUF433 family)
MKTVSDALKIAASSGESGFTKARAMTDEHYGPEAIAILRGMEPPPKRSSVRIGGDQIGWSRCHDVESVPGRCSGAWVVKNTRVTVHSIINNAAAGCSAAEIADMFEVPSATVRRIVAFAEAQEPSAELRPCEEERENG